MAVAVGLGKGLIVSTCINDSERDLHADDQLEHDIAKGQGRAGRLDI